MEFYRGRRLRKNSVIRDMVSDLKIDINSFVYPLFIEEGEKIKTEIPSMQGQYRLSIDNLGQELDELLKLGIKSVLLFGIPKTKDEIGSGAYDKDGVVQEACRFIKKNYPSILIVTDVCMCEYTTHGHCGLIDKNGVQNDSSKNLMAKIALSHVAAGADIVAPSDMMDGRVLAIRELLDKNGYYDIPIISYAVKYSSAYYGPFRDAADSAPAFGDRKAYQMDFRRKSEYIREAIADIDEGADIIMVKPGLPYLDVIKDLKERIHTPIAVYNVSGEYSMIKAASSKGWIDEKSIVLENCYSFLRAGADIIISYHAKDIARWIKGD